MPSTSLSSSFSLSKNNSTVTPTVNSDTISISGYSNSNRFEVSSSNTNVARVTYNQNARTITITKGNNAGTAAITVTPIPIYWSSGNSSTIGVRSVSNGEIISKYIKVGDKISVTLTSTGSRLGLNGSMKYRCAYNSNNKLFLLLANANYDNEDDYDNVRQYYKDLSKMSWNATFAVNNVSYTYSAFIPSLTVLTEYTDRYSLIIKDAYGNNLSYWTTTSAGSGDAYVVWQGSIGTYNTEFGRYCALPAILIS